MPKQKFRMTIAYQVEYEADPDQYDTKDPKEMAECDEQAAGESPAAAFKAMQQFVGGRYKVKVEHVKSAGEKAGLKVKE